MGVLEGRQVLAQRAKQVAKLMGGMKLGELMSLPEDEFQKLIQEVENDPLFKKLVTLGINIVGYKKPPWTRIAQSKVFSLGPTIPCGKLPLKRE